MIRLEPLLLAVFLLLVFSGGYLAVSSMRSLWHQASKLESIASLNGGGSYKTLEFDKVEPSAGN